MGVVIDKRLMSLMKGSSKYIVFNVIFQWIGLIANIVMIFTISSLLAQVINTGSVSLLGIRISIILVSAIIRMICAKKASKASFNASKTVKKTLREKLMTKLLNIGAGYNQEVPTAEAVQLAGEGVEQLETYFGLYLPQFFYAMIAPVTLFIVMMNVSLKAAIVLLVCVPLIPVSIVIMQKFAKKLLGKYWGQYAALGDSFLENLQGLTTLKIYQADEDRHKQMNLEAEHFRKVTMKVLTMQLNSIIVMDVVAYGGAALGMVVALNELASGQVDLTGCLCIILLAADFFLPMRTLGSYFHVAMNGMTASDKIFRLLELEENDQRVESLDVINDITLNDIHFSYEKDKEVLHGVDMQFPVGSFTAIVGESGCGKSTIAALLTGRNTGYQGSIKINSKELATIKEKDLMNNITLVAHNSTIFMGTVADNLRLAGDEISDEMLWQVLEQVNLADFLRSESGLETKLTEGGANLSGGQRQRLALARALLHDSPVYIFDEATSNIDVESENDIMKLILEMAKEKTIILISHRLANVVSADNIYVLEHGNLVEEGTHEKLLKENGVYQTLWHGQQELETFAKEVVA